MPFRSKYIILLLSLSFLLSSCKDINDITFRGIDNVVFQGIENNRVNFSADVSMVNPSSVSFKVSEVNLKTIIDGNFIGTLSITGPVRIIAKSDTAYHTGFSLQIANILSGASTLYTLSRKKQVTIEMQGYVKAKSWLVRRKVPVQEKQVVDVPSFNR